ncbi:integrase core domain-containing protein [Acinetobacter baumannii]
MTEQWRHHYNHIRPHSSLGYKPPAPLARMKEAASAQCKATPASFMLPNMLITNLNAGPKNGG